ncbi:hypothetical protein TruAng_000690 [Truncatella angustata]|nr:hypothetical protein TruAng_000690 [Truncatella angustata]
MGAGLGLHGVNLPSQYEIRRIQPEHEDWCRALMLQGMLLRAPVWRPIISEPKVKTILESFQLLESYYTFHFRNGLSYALYDTEYKFKRPESVKTGGALYWDEIDIGDPELEEKGEQLMLEKMDFPIVALALSYDMFEPPPREAFGTMATVAPLWGAMIAQYGEATNGIGDFPKPTSSGQYAHRSGCVTRADYEGQNLGRLFTWWVMLEMSSRGYQGLAVGAGNSAISRIWLHPDVPFLSKILMTNDMGQIEIEMNGEKVLPFREVGFQFNYLLCDLTDRRTRSLPEDPFKTIATGK